MKKLFVYLEENFEEVLMVLLLAAISLVMMAQIIARFVFNAGFTWAEEFCRYGFVYSGMLSAGYCIRKNLTIRVDAVYNFFPKIVRRAIDLFGNLLMTAVFAYMAYGSIGLIATTTSISPAIQLPMKYVYAAIPLGFGLGTIRGIQGLIKFFRKPAEEGEK